MSDESPPVPPRPEEPTQRRLHAISSSREMAIVQADYLALANDLEQAQALAASLEIELSGKTNELARFKGIWERTQADLAKLEQHIQELRHERHHLAEEAQRARAYQNKCERLLSAQGEFTARIRQLEAELTQEREAHQRTRVAIAAGTAGAEEIARLRAGLVEMQAVLERVLRGTGPVPASIEIDYEK